MKKTAPLPDIYRRLYAHYGPQYWWPGDTPFEIAVGAVLTQNTNWSNVQKAIGNLKAAKSLNAGALRDMPVERLASLIRPAGYFNVKAQRLKAFIDFLFERCGGSMKKMAAGRTPELREKLLSVRGIGQETADSILLYALEKPVFVIDAYTKRALSRHGVLDEAASYGQYQALFHEKLDRDLRLFNEYHALFVRLGKEQCRPKPRCEGCPLSSLNNGIMSGR